MAASGFYNHLLFKLQYEFMSEIETMADCSYRRYASAAGTSNTVMSHSYLWVSVLRKLVEMLLHSHWSTNSTSFGVSFSNNDCEVLLIKRGHRVIYSHLYWAVSINLLRFELVKHFHIIQLSCTL